MAKRIAMTRAEMELVEHLPTAQLAVGENNYPEGRQVRPMFTENVEEKVQARLRSRAKRAETVLDYLCFCIAEFGLRDAPGFTKFLGRKMRRFDREVYGEELLIVERWLGTVKEY